MDELSESAGPTGLEMVWALHGRAEPEPKQGLNVARVVDAAIELADAEGLAALSMAKVAKRLGFTTMSLYRHVRSKEELILLMQDVAVGPPTAFDEAARPDDGWRAALERWTWAVLAAFRRHPWLLQTIAMFGPPATPNQLMWLERGLRALHGTGLDEGEKMRTMLLVDAHVLSDLQFATFAEAPPMTGAEGEKPYEGMLSKMLDPAQFPALLSAFRGGAFEPGADPAVDRDADFAFGLERILDGIERLVEQRRCAGP